MAFYKVTLSHRRIYSIFSEDKCFNLVIIFLEDNLYNDIFNKN